MKEKHYTQLVDETVGFDMYTHTTLRTCFDPASNEWTETNLRQKVEILEKVIAKGNNLQDIIWDYKDYYNEINKSHVGKHLEDGLIELLQHLLTMRDGSKQ